MAILTRRGVACGFFVLLLCSAPGACPTPLQEPDAATVIQRIDAAVQARYQHLRGFTAIERYAVFRGEDQAHPVAAMTVKDTYRKGVGKTYTIVSRSGSEMVQRFGLKPLLDNEASINNPSKVAQSWFASANYEMRLKPGGVQRLNGRDCFALAIHPKRKAPNLIDGTLWVDAADGSTARIDGVASKNPSAFAGVTHMMREYAQIDGFPMATHARAESSSMLFGRTVVTIDYGEYHLERDSQK